MSTLAASDNGRSRTEPTQGALVPVTGQSTPQHYSARPELERSAHYAQASKAEATRRAYISDFSDFEAWCRGRGLDAMPATIESTCRYLSDSADGGLKASTIRRRAAAITYMHRIRGFEPPTSSEAVKAVLSGIRRELGVKPDRKAPITADVIAKMLRKAPASMIGARDRALLLVAFAGALRRSELVALKADDLERSNAGLLLHIRKSKTDQEGEGRSVAIPKGGKLKAAEQLLEWLGSAGITAGPLFRSVDSKGRVSDEALSDKSVARIVKRYASRIGLAAEDFSGHSLRAGFVTSALDHGADHMRIMDVTGHRDVRTLKVYDRRAKFDKHAGRGFL